MKKQTFLSLALSTLLVVSLTMISDATDIKDCQCGYTADGDCISCKKVEEDEPRPKLDNSNVKNCPCGYRASGKCKPCEERKKPKKSREIQQPLK